MSYRAWLIQIGKSASTADKYSRAVTGVISTWAKNEGLTLNNLKDVNSIYKRIEEKNREKNRVIQFL